MLQITRTLSSAEILALHTTAIVLVPAPGTNRKIIPMQFAMSLHAGGTPYAGGSDLNYLIGAGGGGLVATVGDAGIITQAADFEQVTAKTALGELAASAANTLNQALSIKASGAAFTAGNGTVTLQIFYAVIQSN